jgi:hypothetical protein
VITDAQILRLFELADPARIEDPAPVIDAASCLDGLRRRSGPVTLIDDGPGPARRAGVTHQAGASRS